MPVPDNLSYDLHALTRRLDRAADRLLQSEENVSYARFLALFAAGQSAGTQRELAQWLGLTEPSTSRMVGVLVGEGLLEVHSVRGSGNRRNVRLTGRGSALVERCGRLLDQRFREMVQISGVAYDSYQADTRRLLDLLDKQQAAAEADAKAVL